LATETFYKEKAEVTRSENSLLIAPRKKPLVIAVLRVKVLNESLGLMCDIRHSLKGKQSQTLQHQSLASAVTTLAEIDESCRLKWSDSLSWCASGLFSSSVKAAPMLLR
jgi:hypothetical protein